MLFSILIKQYWKKLIVKIKKTKLDPNSFTFFFFLVVSTIFWFFNALSNNYIATIKVPVKFVNLPENKLTAKKIVNTIDVKIAANGYSFLKYSSSTFNEALINLQLHSIHKVSETNDKRFYLLTSTIKNEIANLLDKDTQIKQISPDSIIFELDEVIKKKVPVIKNFQINYRKQFMLKNKISVNFDSVYIRGIKSILDTIEQIKTIKKTFTDVHDSLEFEIPLKQIQGVVFSKDFVKYNIPVEEFAELSFTLPIDIINLPNNYNLKLFPAEAKVICNVGFSQYRLVFKEQFQFLVDYNDTKNNPDRIRLNLIKHPENISSVRYYPISVEYLVEEND